MRFLARERAGAVARRLGAPLLLAALSCAPVGGPELPVVERVSLAADSFSSLHVDAGGRIWLGGEVGLRVVGAGGMPRRMAPGGEAPAHVAAEMDGRLFVQAGERLLALDVATGETLAGSEEGGGRVLADPRGRWLLVVSPSGGVRGLDPATLEPLWLWPPLGESAAAALSPEGDRAYLVASAGGGAGALLSRDLQTGRMLGEEELPVEVTALLAGRRGELFAVLGGRGGGAVAAMLPTSGELRSLWRRRLGPLGLERPAEVRLGPDGKRLALFSPGRDSGLRVLDAETGKPRGRVRGPVLDAAFAADGASLYFLTPSGVGEARVP